MSDSKNTLAQAVTAHRSFALGGHIELFAVQAGVPLNDALNNLSLLIGCANSTITDGASRNEETEVPWAAAYLLEAAYALTTAIHVGLNEAMRADPARAQGGGV